MKYALISAALLLGVSQAQPALAQKPSDLVAQAVKAQGGADALRALKGIAIKGEAKFWEPGQSFASRASSAMRPSPPPGIWPRAWRAPNGTATRNIPHRRK